MQRTGGVEVGRGRSRYVELVEADGRRARGRALLVQRRASGADGGGVDL